MRLQTDDDVHRLRLVFLGMKDVTWPFEARYLAWGTWAIVAMLSLIILMLTSLFTPATAIWALVLSVLATRYVMRWVDADHTLRSVVGTVSGETSGWIKRSRKTQSRSRCVSTRSVRVRDSVEGN